MKILNIHILTTGQLLKYGYEQMVKTANDSYWQGREDERNNIDSPYFDERRFADWYRDVDSPYKIIDEWGNWPQRLTDDYRLFHGLVKTPMPKYILDKFKEDK